MLSAVGIDGPLWFNDPHWSKPALTLLLMWGVGNLMIIFLAALIDVPRHLYESAELDGAGAWQRLRWVTLPTISPVLLFAVVIGTIEALQIFDQAYVGATIAAGSASSAGDPSNDLGYPEDSTLFYPVLLFQQGFRFFNMGYAAAMAVLLLVVSLAITLAIVRNSRRWVHYAGGPLTMSTTAAPAVPVAALLGARPPRGPARGPPQALPGRGRRPQPADRRGDRVRLPDRLHAADGADDQRPGALDEAVARAVPVEQLQRRSSTRRRCSATALNTLIYSGLATLFMLISSVPVAYALARLRWKGRDAVFLLVLVAMMLPPQVTIVPLYVMWAKLNLVGTLWPLILPNLFGDAFSIFLLRQFFLTIPESYLDAARVDGCGEFRILVSVVCRLAKPALAAVALFMFLFTFSDFFGPLLYAGDEEAHWTLSVGLAQFRTLHQVQWNLTMAATIMVLAPVVVLFFLAQQAFVEGVTLTGVKE